MDGIDLDLITADEIANDFLHTLDSDLSRLGEQRKELTIELAEQVPDGDEQWERIAGMVERMLDHRLMLLALDVPEALIGVRTSTTQH